MKKGITIILFTIIIFTACSSTKEISEYSEIEGQLIESGVASWYGPNFHGKQTANGEIYNQYDYTAAHKTLAFGSVLRVINKSNGKSVIVRINDRGPFVNNRIIDLSKAAAEKIDMINTGTARVDLYLLNNTKLPEDIKKSTFTIQIASFLTYEDANKFRTNISDSFVKSAEIDGKKYFRVYVGKFSTKTEAREKLTKLKSLGYDGFIKQIEN